jgi:hypothetical protein
MVRFRVAVAVAAFEAAPQSGVHPAVRRRDRAGSRPPRRSPSLNRR